MALKVIGTGLGRTGTHSLKLALEQTGFGKCYHMFELFLHPENLRYFKSAEKGEAVDWDALFNGYLSAVDYPVARYWKQLVARYPEALVIHTQRDAEAWYQSCIETIFWASKPDAGRKINLMLKMPFSSVLRKRFPVLMFDGKLLDWEFGTNLKDKAAVIKKYNDHNQEVLDTIPKERLLLFNVKDGWAPLCNFLKVPVPATPFPKSNTRAEFMNSVKRLASGKPIP